MCPARSISPEMCFYFCDENRVEKDRKIQLPHGLSVEIYGIWCCWNADNSLFTRFRGVYKAKQVYFNFTASYQPRDTDMVLWGSSASFVDFSLRD